MHDKVQTKKFRKFLLFIILRYVHSLRVFKLSNSKVSPGQISTIFVKNRDHVESGRSVTVKMDGSMDWTIFIDETRWFKGQRGHNFKSLATVHFGPDSKLLIL